MDELFLITLQYLPRISILSQAGRVAQLDDLASQFFMAAGDARTEIYKEASELAAEVGPAAKHYMRVMEKVVNGTEDYVSKESKRCVFLYLACHIAGKHPLNSIMTACGLCLSVFRRYCRNGC